MEVGLLISKAIRGKLTAEEEQRLQAWLNEKDGNRQLYNKLLEEAADPATATQWLDGDRDEVLQRIKRHRRTGHKTEPGRVGRYRKLGIAVAAAAILAAVSVLYPRVAKPPLPAHELKQAVHTRDLHPGGNVATLTLGNGSVIALNKQANGTLASQGNTTILKPDSGSLVYNAQGNSQKILYNRITTPRGGRYKVTLPDGSRVWLNAGSSLRFPTAFRGGERKVTLTGEAYFDIISYPDQPFIVETDNIQITELGTQFNIMAYDDEPAVKTTLIDGAVKVGKGAVSVILRPGEQAQAGINIKGIQVKSVDTAEAVAWKNGLFLFHGTELKEVLRQLTRWYDIDIVYNGKDNVHLNGMISRRASLSAVLDLLKTASNLTFKKEGNTITVFSVNKT